MWYPLPLKSLQWRFIIFKMKAFIRKPSHDLQSPAWCHPEWNKNGHKSFTPPIERWGLCPLFLNEGSSETALTIKVHTASVMPASCLCPGFMKQAASFFLSLGALPLETLTYQVGSPWTALMERPGGDMLANNIQQGKKLEGLEKTAGDSSEDRGKGPLSLPDWETAGSTLFWCWDRTLGNTVPCSNVETTNIPDEFIDFSKISR